MFYESTPWPASRVQSFEYVYKKMGVTELDQEIMVPYNLCPSIEQIMNMLLCRSYRKGIFISQ